MQNVFSLQNNVEFDFMNDNIIYGCYPSIQSRRINEIENEEEKVVKIISELSKVVLTEVELKYLLKTNCYNFIKKNDYIKSQCELEARNYTEVVSYTLRAEGAMIGVLAGSKIGVKYGTLVGKNAGMPTTGAIVGGTVGGIVGGLATGIVVHRCFGDSIDVFSYQKSREMAINNKKSEYVKTREFYNWKNERWKNNIKFFERILPDLYNEHKDEIECAINNNVMNRPTRAPNGKMYEYEAIESWVTDHATDPLTREELTMEDMEELSDNYYLSVGERIFLPSYNSLVDRFVCAKNQKKEPDDDLDFCLKLFFEMSEQSVKESIARIKNVISISSEKCKTNKTMKKFISIKKNKTFETLESIVLMKKDNKYNMFQKIKD